MPTTISIEPPRQAEIERLLHLSAEYAQSLYPPESNFLMSVDELETPDVTFYVARGQDEEAQGIAALVSVAPGRAELKRMFVDPLARGQGIADLLLERIETDAMIRGIREIVLETGPLHEAALGLYRKHGYDEIPPFGPYVGEEFSVCFAKGL
ncbi:MAG: hypothetical protein JWQ68_120 [Cryobacterium sp.]|jgi:putative acetyltransferase|nr:hypothetical protein [Cryobacterium sp.]